MSQIYSKDSFDRFGDDLCEFIVSFLSIGHKFRFQCVCRQWQRLVFNRQLVLDIDRTFNVKFATELPQLKTILKKCRHIRSFKNSHLVLSDSHMKYMIRYCRHLTDIHVMCAATDVSRKTIKRFFYTFGPQLNAITCELLNNTNDKYNEKALILCQNVSTIGIYSHHYLPYFLRLFCVPNMRWFSNLKSLSMTYRKEYMNGFKVFVQNYAIKLRSFEVIVDPTCDKMSFNILMHGLSQMVALIDVKIICYNMKKSLTPLLPNQLRQIGINCRKLKSLSLNVRLNVSNVYEMLFKTIGHHFRHLKRLEITDPTVGLNFMTGVVTAVDREPTHTTQGSQTYFKVLLNADHKYVNHSANISDGYSGGPVVDMNGHLIGIALNAPRRSDGTFFATTSADIKVFHKLRFGSMISKTNEVRFMTDSELNLKVFEAKPSLISKTNEVRFMTDSELNLMLEMARNSAAEKIAMPPVLSPKDDTPRVLATDYELQGYIDSKFLLVDSSAGYSDQTRLIVVREPNGVLREANREERYRMNQMFFPKEERLLEEPKMFCEPNLTNVLDRHEYEFVLNRACLQYEPNDPKYIDICH
ncbi:unnamed protein product, partial [Oppiella nova]